MKATQLTGSHPNTEDWAPFQGGELEGPRPRAMCPACRAEVARAAHTGAPAPGRRPLCFQCYRAELERNRAIQAAAHLDTASEERFQSQLPFEPVNRARLASLRAERVAARASAASGVGVFVDRRRQAQLAARHALQSIAESLRTRAVASAERERVMAAAIRGAELQLPESWLPFVVSR